MTQALSFDPATTALISIDLQHGIVGRPLAPHPADQVIRNTVRAADALRAKGGTVVFVHVQLDDMLHLPADAPTRTPDAPPPPAEASQLLPQLNIQPRDVVITKRQWGAFYSTNLEQQLRRRGIRTIVMSGIATNFGVESTARAAYDQGFAQIFLEDAMTSMDADAHRFAIQAIFPRMGQVRSTEDFVAALG
jgi:nicotinamidase-related amidase